MNAHQIDRLVGGTPCLCGEEQGQWHPACYAGKTQKQIEAEYRLVYAKIRARIKKARVKISKRHY